MTILLRQLSYIDQTYQSPLPIKFSLTSLHLNFRSFNCRKESNDIHFRTDFKAHMCEKLNWAKVFFSEISVSWVMSDYLRGRHHWFRRLNPINWEIHRRLWRNWWNFQMAYSFSAFAILHMTKTKLQRRCGSSIQRNDYRICSHTTSLIFDQMRIEWLDDVLFGWHGLIGLEHEWYWEILATVGYCNSLIR